jgi:ubiquinone/menaquinone biosynthesis C-methylase UbiE
MVWGSVIDEVNDNIEYLEAQVKSYSNQAEGSLVLDPDFEFPKYYTSLDVHLMPGNYEGRIKGANSLGGAVYDNGFNVFAFGAMGKQFNDIGMSMANCVRLKFPDLLPEVIVDVGCTIGHNTLPWKETFSSAEVYGLDLAGPCLQYAHARAEAMNIKAHFRQASAQELPFDDESVDIVFSSMFLHEMPVKEIRKFMDETFRVLKKGGVMIHMELPPNDSLSPYDAFYLDWDSYYNNEPFYKTFRDLGYRDLCSTAGFQEKSFFESVMPRFTYVSEEFFEAAVSVDASFDENTGRLSDGIQWYGFGSRKD